MSLSEAQSPQLKRAIGPKLLLLFVVGDILGTGVYAITGEVGGEVGGAMWLSFLLAFIIAMLTAGSYVELVTKYPRAAGAALYTDRAFQIRMLTFFVAFAVMCSGLTSASAAARAFGGDYMQQFIHIPTVIVAAVFVLVLAAINFWGVKESVRLTVFITCVEIIGLLIIIGIGVYAVLTGSGEPSRLVEFKSADELRPVLVTSGAALAFFSFVGFEDSVNMAEEVHQPHKAYPRALFLGVTIAGLIYLAVALVSALLVPTEVLEKSSGPLLEVVAAGAPAFPLWAFAIFALFAVTNSALIQMLMASRLVYGMSNERVLPPVFGKVHPRTRTPWLAIVFITVLALVLAMTGDIASLGGTTALLLLVVFAIVNIAVLALRKERVDHEHFTIPTIVPILGALTSAYLASPLSGRDLDQYRTAGILLLVGLVLWAINRIFIGKRSSPEGTQN